MFQKLETSITHFPLVKTLMSHHNTLPFRIGADPEFLLFHGKKALDAEKILRLSLTQRARRDIIETPEGFRMERRGEIGWDHARSTGEIRPQPAASPVELTNNIASLIVLMKSNLPRIDYTLLSIGSPIGGHIHLDLPRGKGEQFQEHARMIMATFLMPIFASEHPFSSKSRLEGNHASHGARGGYGSPDDVRIGEHENGNTFEIRGISAEWLATPRIAQATLAYMGVVWNETLKREKEITAHSSIFKTTDQMRATQQLMLSSYSPGATAVVKSLKRLVQTFELYPQFKKEIDFIMNPKAVYKEKERVGWNLSNAWGGKPVNATKRELMNKKKLQEKLMNKRTIPTEDGFHIPYNSDYKIASFSQAITDRIEALSWNITKQYFLFGFKKGVEGYGVMQGNGEVIRHPTNTPLDRTHQTFNKMRDKFLSRNNGLKINPHNGKTLNTEKESQDLFIIGIPYDVRAKDDVDELIHIIWSIENNKLDSIKNSPATANLAKDEKQEEEMHEALIHATENKNQGPSPIFLRSF